ncbi:MAG TPA: tetratricopeptide repeat protein [Oculatellaceae cyanobacterium]
MRCAGKSTAASLDLMSRCNRVASLYAAGLFFGYLALYSIACPTKELLTAAGVELLFFLILAAWRFKRRRDVDNKAKESVVTQLTEDFQLVSSVRYLYKYVVLAGWSVILLFATSDFAALACAFTGNAAVSEFLYTHVSAMSLIGARPASTAEILAGAYVRAKSFDKAQAVYGLIEQVRTKVYGPESEQAVGLLADYGDLYAQQSRYDKAEEFYSRSITMSKKTHGATGYGRPLTGLANCYRQQKQFAKAESLYKEALAMRLWLYGSRSEKVAQTLKEYSLLLSQVGRTQESESLAARAEAIDKLHAGGDNSSPVPTLCLLVVVFFASYLLLGRRGVLTNLAVTRLQARIQQNSEVRPEDVKRLELLLKYQGIRSRASAAEELVG